MRVAMVVAYVALERPRLRRAKMYPISPDYLKVRVEEPRHRAERHRFLAAARAGGKADSLRSGQPSQATAVDARAAATA